MSEREKEPLLRVEHLKKYFQTPAGTLHAVDDVNFTINEGETLGVVGESGCGKSTMGRTILRLHEPTSGKVYFEGKDVTACNKKELNDLREEMQIIFQDPFASLNPRMTVSEAIAEPLLIRKKFHKNDHEGLQKRVEEVMDLVGLARRLVNSYPHELDGGRRQRIGIGRVLALRPKFVVCDEPVSALDVSIQAQILNLMQDLQEQLAFLHYKMWYFKTALEAGSEEVHLVETTEGKRVASDIQRQYQAALAQCHDLAELISYRETESDH